MAQAPITRGLRELLRQKRENGWSQKDLARMLSVSQPSICAICVRSNRPGIWLKHEMLRVLGIEPDDWLTADEYRAIYGESREAS